MATPQYSVSVEILNFYGESAKFKRTINLLDLPPPLRKEVTSIKKLEAAGKQIPESEAAKFKLIQKFQKQKDATGKAMSNEIGKLRGKTIDGARFRKNLEGVLGEQGITITRTPETRINRQALDEIIELNPNDPRVQQIVEDRKILSELEPNSFLMMEPFLLSTRALSFNLRGRDLVCSA